MNEIIEDKITILVNSCDDYSDMWQPFFTLLKKYWDPQNTRIILNTETKQFSYPGLNIECINSIEHGISYGKRIHNVLSKIKTPYVVLLLDDFFLRKPVNHLLINSIIKRMDNDRNIICFNCDIRNKPYVEFQSDLYCGFHRLPPGSLYNLSMQASIWRTNKLSKYWNYSVSPWEWEEFTNLVAARNKKEKIFSPVSSQYCFAGYGNDVEIWGVYRGKWVKDDVVPLFEKEGIDVDFSKRGFLEHDSSKKTVYDLRDTLKTLSTNSDLINRCLTKRDRIKYYIFVKRNKALGLFRYSPDMLYIKYQLLKERKKFIRRHPELLNQNKG